MLRQPPPLFINPVYVSLLKNSLKRATLQGVFQPQAPGQEASCTYVPLLRHGKIILIYTYNYYKYYYYDYYYYYYSYY